MCAVTKQGGPVFLGSTSRDLKVGNGLTPSDLKMFRSPTGILLTVPAELVSESLCFSQSKVLFAH